MIDDRDLLSAIPALFATLADMPAAATGGAGLWAALCRRLRGGAASGRAGLRPVNAPLMGEHKANIGPKYAVRLSDLRRWHIVTAVCGYCRHQRRMCVWQFRAAAEPYARLADIEARLRCQWCGMRGPASVLVPTLVRDDH